MGYLTGVEQRVTSTYHPISNRLIERQNRTIKATLVKVLEDNPSKCSYVIERILFAHCFNRHSSTKYSPVMNICITKSQFYQLMVNTT